MFFKEFGIPRFALIVPQSLILCNNNEDAKFILL